MFVFNDSGGNKTYEGTTINDQTYYQVQSVEQHRWASNSDLVTDIGSGDIIMSTTNSTAGHITDVADAVAYLQSTTLVPRAPDGTPCTIPLTVPTGWYEEQRYVEFKTSTASSLVAEKADGTSFSDLTIAFLDDNEDPITAGSATITRVTWSPTQDYYLAGAGLDIATAPTENVRAYLVRHPDVSGGRPLSLGGNLRAGPIYVFIGSPEFISYDDPSGSEELRLDIRHDQGSVHEIFLRLDTYIQ